MASVQMPFFSFSWQNRKPVRSQSFPMAFPLSAQSGKLKGTSEKPRGVPPIFPALYFVKQKKCDSPSARKLQAVYDK